jgi:hypothetical protein
MNEETSKKTTVTDSIYYDSFLLDEQMNTTMLITSELEFKSPFTDTKSLFSQRNSISHIQESPETMMLDSPMAENVDRKSKMNSSYDDHVEYGIPNHSLDGDNDIYKLETIRRNLISDFDDINHSLT